MKKIGIVTLQGNFNYGNRLQNFALEQIMLSLDNDVHTLILPAKKNKKKRSLMYIMSRIAYRFTKKRWRYLKMLRAKTPILLPFTNKYLHSRPFDKVNLDTYDAFFVGSDQVWNPAYTGNDPRYFLDFAPEEKRFAYAASFGVSTIPEKFSHQYGQYLNQMHKISVREMQGIKIVETLSKASAVAVADPTLLLTQKKWHELADTAKIALPSKYILVYMLSELSTDNFQKINEYAKHQGAKVVTIMGDKYDPDYWIPTPLEFIAAIRGATAVFTDSFHCTVFSILFETPFITFNRANAQMISRIDTLLSYFNFQKNKFSKTTDINAVFSEMTFGGVKSVLDVERNKGLHFIEECLASIDK